MARYDKATRRAIVKRVKELVKETGHVDFIFITETLKKEGVTAPDGGELQYRTIRQVANKAGVRARRKRRDADQHRTTATATRSPGSSDQDAMFDLILGSDLDDERKVRMLKALRLTE